MTTCFLPAELDVDVDDMGRTIGEPVDAESDLVAYYKADGGRVARLSRHFVVL